MLNLISTKLPARLTWRAALAALVLLLALPGASGAFSKAIWGEPYVNGVNQFPLYQRLHVSIIEEDLNWSAVAPRQPRHATDPNDPAYQWPASIQQSLSLAARYHMQLLLQVIATPGWANGNRPWNWVPRRAGDYAAFAAAAARRYPNVHLWMIWGEPSRGANFQPLTPAPPGVALNRAQQVAPHNYARMLDAAYGALKRVSRANRVIGGGTFTSGDIVTQQWVANLKLPNGRPPRMDMYAHNPFTFSDPSFSAPPAPQGAVQFGDLPRLARWVDHYIRRGIPLFLSEFTIPTKPDNEFNFYVDPPVAAQWVRDALRISRRWHRIYGLGWVHVYDAPPTSYGGLLTTTGAKKPTFDAFARG